MYGQMPYITSITLIGAIMPNRTQPRSNRSERLEARITPAQKQILEEAALLQEESVTRFVLRSALKAARRRLLEEESIKVSDRDRRALVQALGAPPSPNKTLRDAYKRYRLNSA